MHDKNYCIIFAMAIMATSSMNCCISISCRIIIDGSKSKCLIFTNSIACGIGLKSEDILAVSVPISRRLLTLKLTGNPNVPLKGTENGCLHVGQFSRDPALSDDFQQLKYV